MREQIGTIRGWQGAGGRGRDARRRRARRRADGGDGHPDGDGTGERVAPTPGATPAARGAHVAARGALDDEVQLALLGALEDLVESARDAGEAAHGGESIAEEIAAQGFEAVDAEDVEDAFDAAVAHELAGVRRGDGDEVEGGGERGGKAEQHADHAPEEGELRGEPEGLIVEAGLDVVQHFARVEFVAAGACGARAAGGRRRRGPAGAGARRGRPPCSHVHRAEAGERAR